MAWQGKARHGERYWQTPGFKSPERTTAKAVQGSHGSMVRCDPEGKEHNGGPGLGIRGHHKQGITLTHAGGYQ